jgi:hypothetical protein
MKLIPLGEADNLFLAPMLEAGQFDFDNLPFPHMRSSNSVLVFSEGYLVAVSQWWDAYLKATGFKYVPGSGMCEGGTKAFIGHVNEEAVNPFRGFGPVDPAVVEAAKEQGRECPTERLGDFAAGVYEIRCTIPGGVNLNGVTDGGHSTPVILVHDSNGEIVAFFYEWQNSQWEPLDEAVKRGVKILDVID